MFPDSVAIDIKMMYPIFFNYFGKLVRRIIQILSDHSNKLRYNKNLGCR